MAVRVTAASIATVILEDFPGGLCRCHQIHVEAAEGANGDQNNQQVQVEHQGDNVVHFGCSPEAFHAIGARGRILGNQQICSTPHIEQDKAENRTEEAAEMPVVLETDAGPSPGAMVVKPFHTIVTHMAM